MENQLRKEQEKVRNADNNSKASQQTHMMNYNWLCQEGADNILQTYLIISANERMGGQIADQ